LAKRKKKGKKSEKEGGRDQEGSSSHCTSISLQERGRFPLGRTELGEKGGGIINMKEEKKKNFAA